MCTDEYDTEGAGGLAFYPEGSRNNLSRFMLLKPGEALA